MLSLFQDMIIQKCLVVINGNDKKFNKGTHVFIYTTSPLTKINPTHCTPRPQYAINKAYCMQGMGSVAPIRYYLSRHV